MNRTERSIVIAVLANMVIYIPSFFALLFILDEPLVDFRIVFAWHFTGMTLNLIALVVTLRDLYLRTFPEQNTKLLWCILILCGGGIGWLIYIFAIAFKPRDQLQPDVEMV